MYDNGFFPTPDFERLISHLWQGGFYGYFYAVSDAKHPENHPNPKKRGEAKERVTSWINLQNVPLAHAPIPSQMGPHGYRNIYFTVHPTLVPDNYRLQTGWRVGMRAINNLIAAVNCLYAEIDVKDFDGDWQAMRHYLDTIELEPSVIVWSGGGLHLYWLFREPFILYDEFGQQIRGRFDFIRDLQHKWVEAHSGLDQNAKDLTRYLRIFPSINYKSKYAPNFPVTELEKADYELLYDIADFKKITDANESQLTLQPSQSTKPNSAKATPKATPKTKQVSQSTWQPPTQTQEPILTNNYEKARFYIEWFNPSCGRAEWLRVGLMLTGLSEGLKIWNEWSKQSNKYIAGECEKNWQKMLSPDKREKALGLGTLIREAQAKGAPRYRRGKQAGTWERQRQGGKGLTHFERWEGAGVLVVVEGKNNGLSIWQVARERGLALDVVSVGSEGFKKLSDEISRVAREGRYDGVLIWADKEEIATSARQRLLFVGHAIAIQSPAGLGANDLLLRGQLADFVGHYVAMLEKQATT